MTPDNADDVIAHVERVLAQLSEHFDTVQIIATRYVPGPDGGTSVVKMGAGNWYARFASAALWVEECKAREHEDVRREGNEDTY